MLVPPENRLALAAKIREIIGDPARQSRMSAANLETARQYRSASAEKRVEIYRRVREMSKPDASRKPRPKRGSARMPKCEVKEALCRGC